MNDVTELRAFYASPLGALVRRLLVQEIRTIWPNVRGMRVAGLGYPTPFLGVFREEADRTLAFMPALQGVVPWPVNGPSLTALVEPTELPLPDACLDRFLLIHALEIEEGPRTLLREAWRVLAPEGRMIVAVPNRRGVWARAENTPFGQGLPFSRTQLVRVLRETFFEPATVSDALHLPPFTRGLGLQSAVAWERMGRRIWPAFAGVLLVEVTKRLYAPIAKPKRRRRLAPVLEPSLAPNAHARRKEGVEEPKKNTRNPGTA